MFSKMPEDKDLMQGKLFQKCTHLLYCSILSLGGNVNKRRMSKPDLGSIFHIKNQWNILVIGNYYVNYQNYQNLMLLTSLDTKRTLIHLFLFTNSTQKRTSFNMYAEYTQLQLTFIALHPWYKAFTGTVVNQTCQPLWKWRVIENNVSSPFRYNLHRAAAFVWICF